jgi:hypothetical protein
MRRHDHGGSAMRHDKLGMAWRGRRARGGAVLLGEEEVASGGSALPIGEVGGTMAGCIQGSGQSDGHG